MRRTFLLGPVLLGTVALAALTGCERYEPSQAQYASSDATAPAPARGIAGLGGGSDTRAQSFSYSHFLSLAMDASSVAPRFKRARDLCLSDATFACELVASNISEGSEEDGVAPSAQLTLMLPHAKVDEFEDRTVAPLAGEEEGSVKTRVRSSSAENVTQQLVDLDKRMAQLTDYRDRLTALTKRSDVRAAELIQLADALSKAQAELDEVAAMQRDTQGRVAKERLTISLGEREGSATLRPITRVFSSAGAMLVESTASALRFLILSLPWLPILAAAIAALGWLWRLIRRRRVQSSGT